MKKGLALLTTLGLAITGCTTNVFAADVVIKLADVQAENDVETQFEYKFAELVNEKSDGRIEVQVYPAGQMGEMTDILTAVQSGSMQMTRTNPSWLADAGVSSMNLLALPFVFDDLDSANKVLDSDVGQKILNQVEESDTNDLATKMVSSLGASATPISYNELYSSLQTGIVDGADNPLKGILNMSFYEVGSYVLDMPHQYEASVIIINSDFFNSLSEEDQAVINEAMEEGAEYFKQISDEALEGYRSQLEEKGMEFVTPDDPQEWKDAAQTIYSEFTEGNEDLLQEIIDCQK